MVEFECEYGDQHVVEGEDNSFEVIVLITRVSVITLIVIPFAPSQHLFRSLFLS